MSTKTIDRTTSADLAARLRERAAEYEEAGREKLRAESALLAAMANYERARYRERAAREEWARRAGNLILWREGRDGGVGHLVPVPSDAVPEPETRCGVRAARGYLGVNASDADCPACLAALDEVQP
jgi:hypothetical protein